MLLNAATVVSASERAVNRGRIPIHALLSSNNTEPLSPEPQSAPDSPTQCQHNVQSIRDQDAPSTPPTVIMYNHDTSPVHSHSLSSPYHQRHPLSNFTLHSHPTPTQFQLDHHYHKPEVSSSPFQTPTNSPLRSCNTTMTWPVLDSGCTSDHSSGSESNQVSPAQTTNMTQPSTPTRSAPRRRWKPHEDALLMYVVRQHGPGRWNRLAEQFPGRNGRQVRLRWVNHLQPSLDKREWRQEEDEILLQAHATHGNKWSLIAMKLSGRTDNSVKNRFKSLARRAFREAKATSRSM